MHRTEEGLSDAQRARLEKTREHDPVLVGKTGPRGRR